MRSAIALLLAGLFILFTVPTITAQAPELVTYQGRLTDPSGNPVADGPHTVLFRLYGDPVAPGPIVWQESHTVTTTDGLFSVTLGTDWALDYSVVQNLPASWVAYLGVKVGTDPEMTPRVRLTSVMYAQQANHAFLVRSIHQALGGTITGTIKVTDSVAIGTGFLGPSERLDVAGNARVSGRVAIQTNAGPTAQPPIGERWRDNSIVAWANVGGDGTIFKSFGVDSVQHVSAGRYMIYLSNAFSSTDDMIPIAQSRSFINNHFLTAVVPITNATLEVGMKFINTNEFMDGNFSLIVTGR